MIRYTLVCDRDHRFDSWFQSYSAFETLAASGHLACSVCGSGEVSPAMMAPAVPAKSNRASLSDPMSDAETALTKLRTEVEANSDDVGQSFAQEAQKMHDGDTPQRSIHGVAKLDEARKLVEDGIPVIPLPFMPKRKAN